MTIDGSIMDNAISTVNDRLLATIGDDAYETLEDAIRALVTPYGVDDEAYMAHLSNTADNAQEMGCPPGVLMSVLHAMTVGFLFGMEAYKAGVQVDELERAWRAA